MAQPTASCGSAAQLEQHLRRVGPHVRRVCHPSAVGSDVSPSTLAAWLNAGVDLSLDTRAEGEHTVVSVAGEIDVYTAPKLREALLELVNAGKYHIVVDVERVEFLDSTGLGVLVGGLKRVRAHNGTLQVVCTQERLLKIFRITGLTKVFALHGSVAEAVAEN